jgi:alanine racemase
VRLYGDTMTDPRRRALDWQIRPTRAEVDLGALRHNAQVARQLAGNCDVLAVVKANAYGHGAVPVARALVEAGVSWLGVALVEEGIELRHAGVAAPILVMGGSYAGGYELLVEYDLVPIVFRPEHLEGLALVARAAGKKVTAHLKVDTGMGRIGILPSEVDAFLDEAARWPEVTLTGLASHFANADLADAALTAAQVRELGEVLARMRARGVHPAWRHLANSAGLVDKPDLKRGLDVNLMRPGLLLYGVAPASWLEPEATLRPVLTWKTGVTHVKRVPAGTAISYGSTWRAGRPSVIATLPVGYADGYARAFSNKAHVLVRGRRLPIVGRVCMDMVMADVTDVPAVEVGDEVVLLGAQGEERITADELAALEGTISYEVLCAVSARVPRVIVGA